jgi:hypothetical protein
MVSRTILALLLLSSPVLAQSLIIGSGSQEQIGGGAQVILSPAGLDVQSGGSLVLAGSSAASPAILTSGVTTGAIVNALSGSSIDLKFAKLESVLRVVVATNAKITRIHDTVFTDLPFPAMNPGPGATAWLDLSALTAADRANLPFSFNRVTFQDPQVTPTRLSIKSGAGTPVLRCLGAFNATTNNRWGNSFDQDTANVVLWNTGQVSRTSPAGTFDTVEDALRDALTAAGSTITVNLGATAFIDDVVDFNTVPVAGAGPLGPVVANACLAPMTGKTVFDGDADTVRRGKIVNCTVARGTVEETTAENCTFFDPMAALIVVNNIWGKNCLIEVGFADTGNLWATSVPTADVPYFAGAAGYNFHLVSPGGNAAIDVGTALTTVTDADGEPRGANGKAGGTVPYWDVGADELIVLQTPVITTANNKKTNDNTPIVTGTSSPNAIVSVFFNGSPTADGTVTADTFGAWTYHNFTATKLDGSYVIAANSSNGSVTSFTSTSITLLVDTVCTPPTNVTATPKNGVIDIEWSPSPDLDVLGYRVFRSTTGVGGTYTLLSTSGQLVTGTKYRDSGLTNGQSYSYKVTAVDDAVNEKH